ncbi:MAG: hypothetical protein HOP27_12515 [Anaerolineales bacterium]|nr:hypothetical protein [Anaerolineales bacterium]
MVVRKEEQPTQFEVIALPPLRMTLAHAKDDRVNKKALAAAIKRYLPHQQQIDRQAIVRIIKFLETIAQEK